MVSSTRLDPDRLKSFVEFLMLVGVECAYATGKANDCRPLNEIKGLVGIHVDHTAMVKA